MNIKDYSNYKEITIAEYKEAIAIANEKFLECIKKKDTIGALEAIKYKLKLQNQLNKKTTVGYKENYQGHKRS